jgi:hypothetical protein
MPSKKKKSGKKAPALVEGIELAEIAQEPESCHDASAEREGNTGEDALLAGVDNTPQVAQEQQAAAQVRECDEVREPDPTPAPDGAGTGVVPPRPPGEAEEANGKDGNDFAAQAAGNMQADDADVGHDINTFEQFEQYMKSILGGASEEAIGKDGTNVAAHTAGNLHSDDADVGLAGSHPVPRASPPSEAIAGPSPSSGTPRGGWDRLEVQRAMWSGMLDTMVQMKTAAAELWRKGRGQSGEISTAAAGLWRRAGIQSGELQTAAAGLWGRARMQSDGMVRLQRRHCASEDDRAALRPRDSMRQDNDGSAQPLEGDEARASGEEHSGAREGESGGERTGAAGQENAEAEVLLEGYAYASLRRGQESGAGGEGERALAATLVEMRDLFVRSAVREALNLKSTLCRDFLVVHVLGH